MITGDVFLPKMDGLEIRPGVYLVGEPKPVPGSFIMMRALADVNGALALVELKLTFKGGNDGHSPQ